MPNMCQVCHRNPAIDICGTCDKVVCKTCFDLRSFKCCVCINPQPVKPKVSHMRTDNTSWDELFFGIAMIAGSRSKDPNTQNGACIVSNDRIVIGVGYNGFIRGITDTDERWEKPLKYRYVVHAEANAIDNCSVPSQLKGSNLYIWSSRRYLPCAQCAKEIAHRGIAAVFVAGVPEANAVYDWEETKDIFKLANVHVVNIAFDETTFWNSKIVPVIQNVPKQVATERFLV